MHHKRRRPKHQRAGCLMCKPQKDERRKKELCASSERQMQDEPEDEPGGSLPRRI